MLIFVNGCPRPAGSAPKERYETSIPPPTLADVAPLLDRLPILAGSLDTAPQGELRALFDTLQLDVVYQPAESALDVAVAFYDLGSETARSAAPRSAKDWSAPSASQNANLEPLVEGSAIRLAVPHTKVRREGYLR